MSYDNGSFWRTYWGVSGAPITHSNAVSGVIVTDAPESGKHLMIDDVLLSCSVAMAVTLQEEGTSVAMFPVQYLPAQTSLQLTPRGRRLLPTSNARLQVLTSVSGQFSIGVAYHSEMNR